LVISLYISDHALGLMVIFDNNQAIFVMRSFSL
jgi:hypothetical protein